MEKTKIAITIGILCFALVYAIFVQAKTVDMATNTIGTSPSDNGGLIDQVLQWQDNNSRLYKSLEKSENELETIRTMAISDDDSATEWEEELKQNNKLLGLTEVKGSGVIITLDDNREIKKEEALNINKYLVHAEDLLCIVNELFNAEADAISINDQRIVSTTSIYCDGNIVRINGKMVGVPITIKAIGHPEAMYYALMRPEGYLEYKGYIRTMVEDGTKATIEKAEEITIPKYEGIYTTEYILRGDK